MANAATCEVDACGVLAVGRCVDCGRAFCGSHQALTQLTSGPVVTNLCQPCTVERARRANLPRELEERAVAKARERIQSVAAALERAGVPKVKYYHATAKQFGWWTRQQGTAAIARADAFGRYRTVEDPAGHKYGWFVGSCPWSATETTSGMYGGGQTRRTIAWSATFVTADGAIVKENDPLTGTTYQQSHLAPQEGPLSALLDEIADRLAKHRPA